ncbi:hypothetical protein BH20ACI3_BH20ACI3_06110 [soil metagenome]
MNQKKSAPTESPAKTKRPRPPVEDSPAKKAGERATSAKQKSGRQPRSKTVAQSKSTPAGKRSESSPAGNESFPVVGIGASAGGLEAFRQFLEHLPVDTGMAFVLVQHLDPTHESILTELLSRSTRIPVSEVTDGTRAEPNHVYVIPRNTNMAIEGGVLRLLPREEAPGLHRPIDYFLRSLSEDQSHQPIGVILSGTASDGTLGLEAIKAEGGITFAQDAKSAKYDGMPLSAAAAGHVDFILTPEGIAKELARISRHPYVTSPPAATTPVEEEAQPTGRNGFQNILALLRKSTGVDFTDYKANTLNRRITRRMVLNKFESREDYAKFLRENGAEVEALYQDILINVTSFFRNPETFEVFKEKILPKVVQQRTPTRSGSGCWGALPGRKPTPSPCPSSSLRETMRITSPSRFSPPTSATGALRKRASDFTRRTSRRTSRRSACAVSSLRGTAATASASRYATWWCSRGRTSSPIRPSRVWI